MAYLTINGVGDASFLLEHRAVPFSDPEGEEMHVLLNWPDSECGMGISMLENGVWSPIRPLHEQPGMSAVVDQVLQALNHTPVEIHMRILETARQPVTGEPHDRVQN